MKAFLFFLSLTSCAVPAVTVPKEYNAAFDVACFFYGQEHAIDAPSAKALAMRCYEGMTREYLRMHGAQK